MSPSEFYELKSLVHLDAMKRKRVVTACDGKFKFPSKLEAERGIRRKGVKAYHCQHCHAWHVGSINPVVRQRRIFMRRRNDR